MPRSTRVVERLAHTHADFMARVTPEGLLLAASDNVATDLGWDLQACVEQGIRAVLRSPAEHAAFAQLQRTALQQGRSRATISLSTPGGTRWLDVAVEHLIHETGTPLLAVARDVTDDLAATAALSASEMQWRVAFEHSPIGGALLDETGAILLANDSLCEMLGFQAHELGRMTLNHLVVTENRETWLHWWPKVVDGTLTDQVADGRVRTADGRELWVRLSAAGVPSAEIGDLRRVMVQLEDITERREAELQLADRALHDNLTGLPNRFLTRQWLSSALEDHPGQLVGVLYCDLDRFKIVNDSLGHTAGDDLLVQVASRLRDALPPECLVGRVGGDEFVVVVEGLESAAHLDQIAFRLVESLDEPFDLGGHQHAMSLSLGGAVGTFPEEADPLLTRADMALLRAKRQGRARFTPYDQRQDRVATEADLVLEDELRRSVTAGQLRAHYQPVLELSERRVVGNEALIRWQHPELGLLMPASFLDLAENSGLIRPVGRWILEQACQDAHVMAAGAHQQAPWIAVNASPSQLARPGVAADVCAALEHTGLRPDLLHLELTETALITASSVLVRELHELKERGVQLVLDDFGTGYSSLSLLRDFPVDVVKIDRSFIAPLLHDRSAYAIVKAVIGMCRDMGLPTVAEGIETEEQFAALRALGCSHGQGFLFGEPSPRDVAPAQRRPHLQIAREGTVPT